MTESELVKKKAKPKGSSERAGLTKSKKRFPTLAHIVLSNGLRVDIPKLPLDISGLTSYENLRCALEFAALSTCLASQVESRLLKMEKEIPPGFWREWDYLQLNLEDLLNHLHYAIEGFPNEKGRS